MHQEKRFFTGTATINYAEGTTDGLPLILLHAMSLNWQNWLPVIPLLAWRYRVYAVDMRGHGGSDNTPGAYRSQDFSHDIAQLLRQEIKQSAVILGHSIGALIAMQIAADIPNLVQAIILEDPPISRMKSVVVDQQAEHPLLEWMSMKANPKEKLAALAKLHPDRDAVTLRLQMKQLSLYDPTMMIKGRDQFIKTFDVNSVMSKIICPVLVLQGNPQSGWLDEQDAAIMQASLHDSTLRTFPEFEHGMHQDPILFHRVVTAFIESL